MPPLMHYNKQAASSSSSSHSSSPKKSISSIFASTSSSSSSSNSGLNLSLFKHEGNWTTTMDSGATCTVTPSWLTALSSSSQGLKRPPPAHSNNGTSQPPMKRPMLEKLTDSPSSSNSNLSPLVDLDQLCSILDSDRDRHTEEISSVMAFPSDFSISASSSASSSRHMFNPSPSDVISLD